ncbi:MAG TPA: hypothetical protein VNO32_33830, partial [Candidatus Acidoferrum sp.]|nr:hypothetical protein [Candidatus Acidoferrum sp.]
MILRQRFTARVILNFLGRRSRLMRRSDHVYIMRSLTYNIAYWNLHERALEEREGNLYEVRSGDRVAFIHFSGIVLDDLNSLCNYIARNPFGDGACKQRYTLSS